VPFRPEPGQPFSADDPQHVRVGLPSPVAPLLDGQKAGAPGQPDCGVLQLSADTRARRNGVDTQPTGTVTFRLVHSNPQDCQLSRGEPAGKGGWHWPGAGEPAATFDGHRPLRRPPGALRLEQRHTAERD
jgi:hypothetical protein